VWFVYASNDDGLGKQEFFYLSLFDRCQPDVNRSEIAISDHFYGTEVKKIPEPLMGIYSRYSLSFLK
jgi:hypothetical protein